MHIFYRVCFLSCSKIPCFKHIDAFMFRECPLFFLGSQLVMAARSFPSSMRIFIPFVPEGHLSLGTTPAWQLLSSSLELCAVPFWPLSSYKKHTFIWLVPPLYPVTILRIFFFWSVLGICLCLSYWVSLCVVWSFFRIPLFCEFIIN